MPELLLSWIVLGVVAGLLVFLWSPRRLPGGLWTDIGLGIAGAVIGGYLVTDVTGGSVLDAPLTWGSVLVTLISAGIVLLLVQTEGSRRAERS